MSNPNAAKLHSRVQWRPRAAAWALVLLCGACGDPPGDGILLAASRLGEAYRWEEAKPLVTAYLQYHPEDAAAHYLLGQYYLHAARPNLIIALGEFHTALNRFRRGRTAGALGALMSPVEFEADIHRRIALAHMRMAREALKAGLPPPVAQPQLVQALDHVRKALALTPDVKVLREMKETLERYIEPLKKTPPPPSQELLEPDVHLTT